MLSIARPAESGGRQPGQRVLSPLDLPQRLFDRAVGIKVGDIPESAATRPERNGTERNSAEFRFRSGVGTCRQFHTHLFKFKFATFKFKFAGRTRHKHFREECFALRSASCSPTPLHLGKKLPHLGRRRVIRLVVADELARACVVLRSGVSQFQKNIGSSVRIFLRDLRDICVIRKRILHVDAVGV